MMKSTYLFTTVRFRDVLTLHLLNVTFPLTLREIFVKAYKPTCCLTRHGLVNLTLLQTLLEFELYTIVIA